MTSISHEHANVRLARKQQGSCYIGRGRDIHGVADIIAKETGLRLKGEGIAALVREIRLHYRRGRAQTAKQSSVQQVN